LHYFEWIGEYEDFYCEPPSGQVTIECSGGLLELFKIGSFNHDCIKDPTDNTKATCSLSGIRNGGGAQCSGQSPDELKLTITIGESSAVCDLDLSWQQAKTRLNAWSLCSGEYIYPVEGKSSGLGLSCDLISEYPIMHACTGEEVTLTSMGEDDPTCIEALLTAPNPSTSPSKSPSSNPTEVPTGSPSKEVILLSRFLEDILSSHPSSHITQTHSSRLFFVHNIHFSADTEPKQVTLKSSNGKLCLLCWMESFSTS